MCVLRTTDDPSSHSQTNATLVRMEPQPDFMYPHHCGFATAKRHLGSWDEWPGGTFVSHNLSARPYEATMVRPPSGHSYRWASLCV